MNEAGAAVLVTGATGAIGRCLIDALLKEGIRVRVVARRPVPSPFFSIPIEVIQGEITDRQAVARAMEGINTVFHLAAKLHVPNPTSDMRAEYERVNVEGTRAVVEEARAAGARRVVLFSTVSVYGPTSREPVDESQPPSPDTIYAETKLRAEGVALSARNGAGEPLALVLRLAAVYGSRMKGNYATLVEALARGRFLMVGRGDNVRTLVYDRDAVRAAVLAAGHPLAAGQVYNVSDGAVHSLSEIVATICEALGRRPPGLAVPLPAARAAAVMGDAAMAVAGRPRRLVAAVDKVVESVAVGSERIQRELGFRPEFDLRRGWRETVAAWGKAGGR